LTRLESDRNFVVVTSDYPKEELRPQKVGWALSFFGIGAVGMIASRVLSIEEAYGAVSWNTVFLLASLIPLGQAVQATGTAEWIAAHFLDVLEGMPTWILQAAVAVLATIFTLIMSNVGATVLLVPLAVNIALGAGADPTLFALTVAISTSNSFLIPTHQVNALIMGPGGYRVRHFMRAGGIMTVLFRGTVQESDFPRTAWALSTTPVSGDRQSSCKPISQGRAASIATAGDERSRAIDCG